MGKPILVIDFDGVLHAYSSGWKGASVVTDGPVPGAMAALVALADHFEVNVLSSRSHQTNGRAAMSEAIFHWLVDEGMSEAAASAFAFATLHWPTEKPPALVTIDDRALTFTGDWSDFTVEKLKAFRPWNKGGEFGIDERAAMLRRIEDLEGAVRSAGKVFREYEHMHVAKCTEDGARKARRNARYAALCEGLVPEPPASEGEPLYELTTAGLAALGLVDA